MLKMLITYGIKWHMEHFELDHKMEVMSQAATFLHAYHSDLLYVNTIKVWEKKRIQVCV